MVPLYDGTRVPPERLLSSTAQPDVPSALEELAAAIRANPLWSRLPGLVLIGRCDPSPLLAVAGTFTDEQQTLMVELREHLDVLLYERQFVDYAQAETVCGRLAERLVAAFGAELLGSAQFAAIPRGGLIVLGMLAYHLELRPDQLTTLDAADTERTLFLIDDCSLSGTRLRESLSRTPADSVVFCPLYAPEALCAGIVSREPRILACLSGATLEDTSPAPGEAGHDAWRRQRLGRLGDNCYWPGQTLGVAFAWCTPQTRRWDEVKGCFMEGWDVVPPSRSLKRRLLLRRLENDGAVDYLPRLILNMPVSEADIRAEDRVLWCCQGDGVLVAVIPPEADEAASVYGLAGISAEFWQLLMTQGSMENTLAVLLGRYQVSRQRLEADLNALLEQMRMAGLLVERDTTAHPAGGSKP
ncbi:coenzyme PQQ synthesis protein D (PqqD) [Halomonas ventosae]|uniref:Coenzyme PQQ synthesis protein D (PqqD) n=2 Tax=Halomonadaceae TaxID=28256 RepID=A0A4R6I3U2_9GAMM|nr:coenzyme PQQ synthesis protein D (PqqD) [Halomonas ventosae]